MPELAVCSRPYVTERNCCECEKCLRTLSGVLAAGSRLREFGFPLADDEFIERVRGRFESSSMKLKEATTTIFYWTAVQERARRSCPGTWCKSLASYAVSGG